MPANQTNQKLEDIFADLEVKETPFSDKPSKPEQTPLPELESAAKIEALKKAEVREEETKASQEQPYFKGTARTLALPRASLSLYPKVEKVLEDDLAEIYFKLPKEKQGEFKKKGEVTALKISQLLQAVKVKVKQIFKLIISWLSIIPGVNKYFLEQEAKIKTDRLLALRDKELKK